MRRVVHRAPAFTLIELLVVVAIIALLISILLPSLSRARKQARQIVCVTNMQSMGRATMFYAQQNQHTIIRSESYTHYFSFPQMMLPYLGYDGTVDKLWISATPVGSKKLMDACRETKFFQCPDFPPPETGSVEQPLDYVVSSFVIPYTKKNIAQGNVGLPGNSYKPDAQNLADHEEYFKLDRLEKRVNGANIILYGEAHHTLPVDVMNFHDIFYANQLPLASFPRMASDMRHPGGIANLFFDGHAVALRPSQVDAGWPNPIDIRIQKFSWPEP